MSDELLSIVVDSPLPADPPAASEEGAPVEPTSLAEPPRKKRGRKKKKPTVEEKRSAEAWWQHCHKPIIAAARRCDEARFLCELRIEQFGHWSRYRKLIRRTMAKNPGWSVHRAKRFVMIEHFGYHNVVEERARFYFWWEIMGPWLPADRPTPNEIVERAQAVGVGYMNREEERDERSQRATDRAFASLAPIAPAAAQMQWIITHPLMFRRGQKRIAEYPGDDLDRPLALADLAGAPSRMAVVLLQHALNDRDAFLEKTTGVQSKSLGGNDAPVPAKADEPAPDPLAAFAAATPEEIASWKAQQTK